MVANVVPELVVDRLETVQVDVEQRERSSSPSTPPRCVVDALTEGQPVGEAGELIVVGPMGNAIDETAIFERNDSMGGDSGEAVCLSTHLG